MIGLLEFDITVVFNGGGQLIPLGHTYRTIPLIEKVNWLYFNTCQLNP